MSHFIIILLPLPVSMLRNSGKVSGRFCPWVPYVVAISWWLELEEQSDWRSCSLAGCWLSLHAVLGLSMWSLQKSWFVLPHNMAASGLVQCFSASIFAPKAAAASAFTTWPQKSSSITSTITSVAYKSITSPPGFQEELALLLNGEKERFLKSNVD